MIRLFLMLLGAEVVRRRWRLIGLLGLAWAALGLFVFLDALDNVTLIPVKGLGGLMLLEGAVALLAGFCGVGAARRLRCAKGIGLLLIGGLTIEGSSNSNIALALLIGCSFAADGVLKIVSAHFVRFRGWRVTQALGLLSLVWAGATLQPWPTWYVGTIGCNIGLTLLLTGFGAMHIARRLRCLAPDAPISELLDPVGSYRPVRRAGAGQAGPQELVVHVWTPTGSAAAAEPGRGTVMRRPLIDRYIAAVDVNGVISTGHAALEMSPDLYISHYPAREIDRSPGDFGGMLRATPDNDVRGRFQPSYAEEAAGWCEATMHVRFRRFDPARLREFWDAYRCDDTYNLTSRNCSSTVAAALDAALEGVLAERWETRRSRWPALMRAALSPELWVATLMRKRAESMAWTPGLLLDYARALSAVVDPPPVAWTTITRQVTQRARRHAAARRTSRTRPPRARSQAR